MRNTTPFIRQRARALRREATDAERALWRAMSFFRPRFTRQYPIGDAIADLACRRARVVVEVDGGQHVEAGDAERTRLMEAAGWRVVRFWNNDVLGNVEGVAAVIAAAVAERWPDGGTPEFVASRAGRVRSSRKKEEKKKGPTPSTENDAGGIILPVDPPANAGGGS